MTLSAGEEAWSTAPGNPPKSGERGASSGNGRGPTRPTIRAKRSFSLRSRSSSRRSSRSSASWRVRAEPHAAKVSLSSTCLCDLRTQGVALCADNIELLFRQLRPISCRFLVRSHPDLRLSAPRSLTGASLVAEELRKHLSFGRRHDDDPRRSRQRCRRTRRSDIELDSRRDAPATGPRRVAEVAPRPDVAPPLTGRR